MKIAIVTSQKDHSAPRLKQEFEKRKIISEIILYSNLKDRELARFEFLMLRYFPEYIDKTQDLIKKYESKIVLNKEALKNWSKLQDKFQQYLLYEKNQIPVPEARQIKNWSELKKEKFPYVVKKRISSRGKQAFLVSSNDDLDQIAKKFNSGDFFWQKYIKPKGDFRIFILGGEVISQVVRRVRIRQKEDGPQFGVKVKGNSDLSPKILDLAKKAAGAIGCEFAGLDVIISYDNQPYFLECNLSSQFSATEEKTGENIANKIVEYILKKVK